MQLALQFSAWFLSRATVFIFNRKTYLATNLVVFALLALQGWTGVLMYLGMGFLISPILASIDYNRQKTKLQHDLNTSFHWYHYTPFFVFDILCWVYAAMGLTGDVVFGHIDADVKEYKKEM